MGLHVDNVKSNIECVESVYLQLFREEIRKEIAELKVRIVNLEARLEDPFG